MSTHCISYAYLLLVFVCCVGCGQILLWLCQNTTVSFLVDAGVGIRRACILVGSQKTLPIAVTVLNGLAPQIGGSVGLAVIPCVVSHLVQIVMDSMLVSQWLKHDAESSSFAPKAS